MGDLLALAMQAVLTATFFYPAIGRGAVFGNMAFMNVYPVTSHMFSHVHTIVTSDQVAQTAPWLLLDRQAVRSMQIPLLNHYNLLGMPQFLNFQSAPFSLPHLISYLFPASFGYTVSMFVGLFIAGSGAYAASRVLGTSIAGGLVAGVTFEFSGSLANWMGWPQGQATAWIGWIVFFAVLAWRGRRPAWSISGLAVSTAFLVYAGHPESILLDGTAVALAGALAAAAALFTGRIDRSRAVAGGMRVALGAAMGAMLSAPLWLPGAQLLDSSTHATGAGPYNSLPFSGIILLLVPGYVGYPNTGSHYFGPSNFFEISSAVGPLAVALAAVALLRLRKRLAPLALGATAVLLGVIVYAPPPLVRLIRAIPATHGIAMTRLLMPIGFCIAVLAGLGFSRLMSASSPPRGVSSPGASGADGAVRASDRPRRNPYLFDRVVFISAALAMLVVIGVLIIHREFGHDISVADRRIQLNALGFALASLVAGSTLLAVWTFLREAQLTATDSRERHAALQGAALWQVMTFAAAVLAQVALLMPVPADAASYSHRYFPTDRTVNQVQKLVGNHALAAGPAPPGVAAIPATVSNPSIGFLPETNIAYSVAVFASYDPMTQKEYLKSLERFGGVPSSTVLSPGILDPAIGSASIARLYGVRYILSQVGPGGGITVPSGTTLAMRKDSFSIFSVPGAVRLSVEPKSSVVKSAEAGDTSAGRVLSWRWSSNNSITASVKATEAATLLARFTYLPGWHAVVNGRSVPVRKAVGTMLSLSVPKGRSRVTLTYWPAALTGGIVLAIGGVLIILAMLAVTYGALPVERSKGARHAARARSVLAG